MSHTESEQAYVSFKRYFNETKNSYKELQILDDEKMQSLDLAVDDVHNAIADAPDGSQRLVGGIELLKGIEGSLSAIRNAVHAGQTGDAIGVASGSLTAVSMILKGAAGGIVAAGLATGPGEMGAIAIATILYVVATIVDLISSILEFFQQKRGPSLIDQMKDLLVRARAMELQGDLSHSMRVYEDWGRLLTVGSRKEASWATLQSQMNLLDGNAVTFTRNAYYWLCQSEHQQLPDAWAKVFDAYSTAMALETLLYMNQFTSSIQYRKKMIGQGLRPDNPELIQAYMDAYQSMSFYFAHVRKDFRNLHWLARRMAPIWFLGARNDLYYSKVSFSGTANGPDGPEIAPPSEEEQLHPAGICTSEFKAVWRNEQVAGGAILWGWDARRNTPQYQNKDLNGGAWTEFNGFGNLPITACDAAFFGDVEPPAPAHVDATPSPWPGLHVLLAVQQGTKDGKLLVDKDGKPALELNLKYFSPERNLEYKDLPKNEKAKFNLVDQIPSGVLPWYFKTVKQVRLYIKSDREDGVQVYVIGEAKGGTDGMLQMYRFRGGWQEKIGSELPGSVERIYVNETAVWAMGGQKIWRHDHEAKPGDDWKELAPPPGLGALTYVDIHPGDDGLLIACVGSTYYGYTEEDGWRVAWYGTKYAFGATRIGRLPLSGFPMFNAAWENTKNWQKTEKDKEKPASQ